MDTPHQRPDSRLVSPASRRVASRLLPTISTGSRPSLVTSGPSSLWPPSDLNTETTTTRARNNASSGPVPASIRTKNPRPRQIATAPAPIEDHDQRRQAREPGVIALPLMVGLLCPGCSLTSLPGRWHGAQ